VIGLVDASSIYEVPLSLDSEGLGDFVINHLKLKSKGRDLKEWREIAESIKNPEKKIKIAMVGKYVQLQDAYISIAEALNHGGVANTCGVEMKWVLSDDLENSDDIEAFFRDVQGIIIPGGFGPRGIEGKIKAIQHAREKGIPLLGLCLGMQCAVIEFARNVCGMKKANSSEFDIKTPYPVIDLLPGQIGVKEKGGTMRLGSYPCSVKKGTKLHEIYKKDLVDERHRHRYEVNNKFRKKLEEKGLVMSGIYKDADLVEVVEIKDHPWFMATQFHPEFKSRPNRCHPIFCDFVRAATQRLEEQEELF